MRAIILFTICLCCISCNKQVAISDFQKASIDILKSSLKDPSSAQLRNVREVQSLKGNKAICGEINAKNSYGGYNGFTPFAVIAGQSIIVTTTNDAGSAFSAEAVNAICNNDPQLLQTNPLFDKAIPQAPR